MSGCLDVTPLALLTHKGHRLRKRLHKQSNDNALANNISAEKRVRGNEQQHFSQEVVSEPGYQKQTHAKEKESLDSERNTHDHADNVVICSERYETDGYKYAENFRSNRQSTDVLVCKGCDLFSDENFPPDRRKEMFILVDSDLLAILLHKKTLVHSVDVFFEGFSEAGNHVHLINKVADNHKFMVLFYQLPEGCAKIYTEVFVSRDVREESSSDEEATSVDQTVWVYNKLESGDTKGTEKSSVNDNVQIQDSVTDYNVLTQDSITDETDAKQIIHDQPKEQELSSSAADECCECVQVGSNCKMKISAGTGTKQLIIAKQDGCQNIMDIKIAPSASSSKMVVVLTSDPHSSKLEELLVTELNSKTDLVNISLKSHDSTIVAVRRGSVVMEIEVKEGRELGSNRICEILRLILQDILTPDVIGRTQFDVSVDIQSIIPKEQLGEYVLLRDPEKKHQTCVERSKYDALMEELKKTKEKLTVTGGETINIINPKLSSGGSLFFVLSAASPDFYLHS